jgi:colanic acid biosynthesis glycosyl transferase WcaI
MSAIRPGARWLILSQYYHPELGAPQVRLRALARELSRRGFHVDVVTALPNYPAGRIFPGYQGRWSVREAVDDARVRRVWLYANAGRSTPKRLANYLTFTLTATVACLLGRRPDIVFVESQPLTLGIVALLMKRLRGVPFIYNVPDLQVDVARQLGFVENERFLRIAGRMEHMFMRQAWKVATVTHRFIDHFEHLGVSQEKITFLPNGADTEFLRPVPPSDELTRRWQLRGKKTFLYVGTHGYYHGLEIVIEAASLLRTRSDIVFLLVGQGPERERLRDMARTRHLDNVVFGDSPYDERPELYSIAWASVVPLRDFEAAQAMRPAKLFPSLSCGVPVIYSGRGETAHLIEAHRCGIVAPPNDPSALAEAVTRLAADARLRDSMGRSGRALVEAEYDWSTIVERWLETLGGSRVLA